MKRIKTFIIIVLLQVGCNYAQPISTIKPLNVGDAIPDEVWHLPLKVVNHLPTGGQETVTLADYRDKLIIIDFWATWCKPCISSLYKLDTLQQQFANGLAVIPTTYEDAAKAAPFVEARGWALPTAVSETTLKDYFPHRSIPHQVWIKGGRVLTIAGAEYTTSDYINKILQGHSVDFDHKVEVAFDSFKPLFLDGNGGDGSNMLYQSIISSTLEARIAGVSKSSNAILVYNSPIETLYKTALENSTLIPFSNSRYIIYDVHDTLQYRINPRKVKQLGDKMLLLQWGQENSYCYNLVLPKGSSTTNKGNRMLYDLNDFFGNYLNFKVEIETRPVMALAVVRTANYRSISTKGGESYRKWDSEKKAQIFNNQPLSTIISHMNNILDNRPMLKLEPYPHPIVDETGILGNIDIVLDAKFWDVESIRYALNKYGLDLVEKISTVKMIVFKYADESKQL